MGKNYIVTKETKLIKRYDSGYYKTKILENNEEKFSSLQPESIFDYNCRKCGTNLDGRIGVVKDVLNSTSKLPIPVIPEDGIFMFPTASAKSKNCVWISYRHIKCYEQSDDRTFVKFYDKTNTYIDTSYSIFENQYRKTSQVIVFYNRTKLFGIDVQP